MKKASLHTRYPNWQSLEQAQAHLAQTNLNTLFVQDSKRAESFSLCVGGLHFDYSKHLIDGHALAELVALAKQAELSDAVRAMFAGEHINHTEDRPALHTRLRADDQSTEEGRAVASALEKMQTLVGAIHSGGWRGFSGESITDVVNIGIGGSDLGPRMVCEALKHYQNTPTRCHFVSNIDSSHLAPLLQAIDPARTLFIVASKSFSTLETLENAKSARQWLLDSGCESSQLAQHFLAISSKPEKAVEFGMNADNVLPMWDWVGGRYSLWSAIGLPIALSVGMENFRALLSGAKSMDEHFVSAPFEKNMPVLKALLVFWYTHFWDATNQAVLPYSQLLNQLPSYLQQLEMESLGKSVNNQGEFIDYPTGLVLWGTEGTNGQHSFHQLLHQGTVFTPVDFIALQKSPYPLGDHHRHLLANCIAQSQALMQGKSLEQAQAELLAAGCSEAEVAQLAPHKVVPGNRPNTMLTLEELNPENLGALIALYEHKVYCLGVLNNINPFDQWGVELGKQLSGPIFETL